MNFEFSEEQYMLREQARGFLSDRCSLIAVRKIVEGDELYDADLWQQIAELGWTATVIPEEYGGLGLGYLELSVIAEELGRAIVPVPFSSSVYLATEAILIAGSEEQKRSYLPGLADGSVVGCLAVAESSGHTTAASLNSRYRNGRLSGTKVPVVDGGVASFAIVLAATDCGDGASAYIVNMSDVERYAVNALDTSRSVSRLVLKDAPAQQLGREGEGWALLQKIYDRAAVLFAWEQVGGASAALEMAKSYAMERIAFGRSIASFQAIKHKLAYMYVKNTLARSNCYYGAWALSTDASELPLAAATAQVSAIQAYYHAAKENIQTHGGMGFTWEFDCHFHYKRSRLLASSIGSEIIWQEKLLAAVEDQRAEKQI